MPASGYISVARDLGCLLADLNACPSYYSLVVVRLEVGHAVEHTEPIFVYSGLGPRLFCDDSAASLVMLA